MNETFVVSSSIVCSLPEYQTEPSMHHHSTVWNQTMFVCKVLMVLQDMFRFNITYIIENETFEFSDLLNRHESSLIDIYVRPLSLRSLYFNQTYPLHHMFNWDFGFTIYRPDENHVQVEQFYSKPFSTIVWHSLFCMAVFCAVMFYFLKRLEIRVVDGLQWESSFGYELLMVIGAYCQHIPPIDAVLYSRRGAYFVFFMFAYLIYTYYTSNLLSHLVNDKDRDMDAISIFKSDMEFVVVEDINWIVRKYIYKLQHSKNESQAYKKLLSMKTVTVIEGLQAVKTGKTALLSEYQLLDPGIRNVFENHEICGLTNIDLLTNLKKYFFVSYNFPYKDKFKVASIGNREVDQIYLGKLDYSQTSGQVKLNKSLVIKLNKTTPHRIIRILTMKARLQRMEETGILQRMRSHYHSMTECIPFAHVQTPFNQILSPLSILLSTYLLSVIILMGEIVHSRMFRLWPYLD